MAKLKLPKLSEFKLSRLKDPLTKKRALIYLLILAAVLTLFTVATIGVTVTPYSCIAICHNMIPEYKTWEKSAHANVSCVACHTAPGGALTKIAEDVFVNLPIGIKHFTGYERPINHESKVAEHYEVERCFRCHNIKTREFTPSEGLTMTSEAHQKHLKVGLVCTNCHNRITHKGAEDYEPIKTWAEEEEEIEDDFRYKNFMDMQEGCLRCHRSKKPKTLRGKTAPTGCTVCHPSSWKALPVGHAKGWRKGHGPVAQQNFNYCFKCHDETAKFNFEGKNFCLACHDAEALGKYQEAAKQQPL